MKVLITLEDFPQDEENCGNCTRKGGACERSRNNKTQHNGVLYGINGEPTGIIYKCVHYTGKYKDK